MGGGKRGVGGVYDAQHAQGAGARVHRVVGGVGERKRGGKNSHFCYPVEEDDEEDEDGVGRLLRRCWLRGMPRCADR